MSSEEFERIYPWISINLFHRILQKEHPTFTVTITNYHLKPALKPGENYASQMIRAKVTFTKQEKNASMKIIENCEKSFIIKAIIRNEVVQELLEEINVFEKEIIVYEHILPAAEKMLLSFGDCAKLAPKCYETNLAESYLILEDLSIENYKNCDRRNGLDETHFKVVLTKLAKLHAATAVLGSKNMKYFEKFMINMYTKDAKEIEKFIVCAYRAAATFTKTWQDFEEISAKLSYIQDKAFSKICDSAQCDSVSFNALLHGDLWANNIMFCYDEHNQPVDAIMIDFQIGSWGPVVVDVAYAMFTSSHKDFQEKQWDSLLAHYRNDLKCTLQLLEYSGKIPTLTDIHAQFLLKGSSTAPIGLIGVGLRNLEEGADDTMAKYLVDTEENRQFQVNMISHPNGRKNIEFLLKFYDRKGFLDLN